MLKVELVGNEQLTEEDLDYIGADRDKDDYGAYLKVTHDGKIVSIHRDGGEPEDNSFFRDYSWVSSLVQKAYKLGLKDKDVV